MATADANRRRLTVGKAPEKGLLSGGKSDRPKLSAVVKDLEFSQYPDFANKVKCIHSVTDSDMKKKRSYAEKDKMVLFEGKITEQAAASAPDSKVHETDKVNFTCRKGLKPESPNQDSYVVVVLPGEWGLYGVFDGHGPNGHDVSDFAVVEVVSLFFGKEFLANPGKAFTEAFTECQAKITDDTASAKKGNKEYIDSSSSGSTCTMAFHDFKKDELTIAWVGDSRGVVYQSKVGDKPIEAVKPVKDAKDHQPFNLHFACEDHKPNLPEEKKRIEKQGGRVVFDGYYNYRVFAKAGMYPGLNMSRALGDCVAHKEAGLSAEPELKIVDLKELRGGEKKQDLFLIIASDGVWEFIQNDEAPWHLTAAAKAEWEAKKAAKPVADAAGNGQVLSSNVNMLAQKSWDAWMEDSDNEISDDISVIAVNL